MCFRVFQIAVLFNCLTCLFMKTELFFFSYLSEAQLITHSELTLTAQKNAAIAADKLLAVENSQSLLQAE